MTAADMMIMMPVREGGQHGHGCGFHHGRFHPHHHFKSRHTLSHPLLLDPPHGRHPHDHCPTSYGPPRSFGRHGHHFKHHHHHCHGRVIPNGLVGMVGSGGPMVIEVIPSSGTSSEEEDRLHPETRNDDSRPTSQEPAITEIFLDFVPHRRHGGHELKRHGHGHHKVKRCHHGGHKKKRHGHGGMRRCASAPPGRSCCHSDERGNSARTSSAPINDVENCNPNITTEGVEETNEALAVMALNETNNNNNNNVNPSP